jgi:hypothetical protein
MSEIDSRSFVTYPSRTNTTIALTIVLVTIVIVIFIIGIILLSRMSKVSSTTTVCTTAPDPPIAITASYVSPTQFNVIWAPSQGANSFIIYIGNTNGFSTDQAILTKMANSPPAAITNLPLNKTYYILIVAVNACGNSTVSEQISFTFSPS